MNAFGRIAVFVLTMKKEEISNLLTGVPCSRVHPPAGRIISICVLAPGYYVEILQCRLIYFTLKFYMSLFYYLYPEEGKSFVFELIPY